jgi:peptidoglycan hydrolase-like protein with peptidoglycan-binding domain
MTLATISEGAKGSEVKWAQYLLVLLRQTLDYHQIDGDFGPQTKSAVEEFQQSKHLAVDGVVGPATWGALAGSRHEPPTLAEGAHGSVVEKLQTALNFGRGDWAPNNNPPLAVDGVDGPKTAAAVRGAQSMGGIPADGIVGLQTWTLPIHAAGMMLGDECGVN